MTTQDVIKERMKALGIKVIHIQVGFFERGEEVSQVTVNNWIRQKKPVGPTFLNGVILADILGVTPAELACVDVAKLKGAG